MPKMKTPRLHCHCYLQLSQDASFFLWSTARYLEAAVQQKAFVDKEALSEAFISLIGAESFAMDPLDLNEECKL